MRSLIDGYDALLVDLDGVVFTGGRAVAGVPEALDEVRARGVAVRFVTNNASRNPEQVAAHLREVGVSAEPAEVMTSSVVGVRLLSERARPGAVVAVVGSSALADMVRDAGFAVASRDDDPASVDVVIQGFSPDLRWSDLAFAAHSIQAGADWVATNTDASIPLEKGPAPGNGAMVAAVGMATGTTPVSAGKPQPAMFVQAADSAGASRVLMVGDRLDTDVVGARAAGFDVMAVLSGVSSPLDVVCAEPAARPTCVGRTLADVLAPPRAVTHDADGWWTAGDAKARWDGALVVDHDDLCAPDAVFVAALAVWGAFPEHSPHAAARESCRVALARRE